MFLQSLENRLEPWSSVEEELCFRDSLCTTKRNCAVDSGWRVSHDGFFPWLDKTPACHESHNGNLIPGWFRPTPLVHSKKAVSSPEQVWGGALPKHIPFDQKVPINLPRNKSGKCEPVRRRPRQGQMKYRPSRPRLPTGIRTPVAQGRIVTAAEELSLPLNTPAMSAWSRRRL